MHTQYSDAAPSASVASTEALLDRIVQRSPVGMAVIDLEGLFRVANPAYGAIFGCRPEDLLGRSFLSLRPPADRAGVLEQHQRFLEEGGELKGEVDVLRSDGTPRRALVESVRLLGDAGRPLRLVYVVDITERRQSELTLQAQRHFLQSVLDGMGAAICVVDEEGLIVKVNRAWREFGLRNGGVDARVGVGTHYLQVCERAAQSGDASAPVAARFAELLRAVLSGQRGHFELEYPCHGPDQRRWFLARVSRIEGSQPARIVIAHDDVSALKLAQETLRESEALLSDMTASIPGAVFRLEVADDGSSRLLYLSPGVQPLLGVHADEALRDLSLWWACIVPEDRQAHDASLRLAVAQAAPWEHAYRIRVAATDPEKWVLVHAGPPRRGQGALIFTGVLTDITQRMRTETALRASEETYRTLFETVAQGVVYQDSTGRITSANPAAQRILGLTLEQLQGRASVDPRWHAMHEDGSDFPGAEHPAMEALRTGLPVKDVVMGIDVPGRDPVWILVSAMPLVKQGAVQGVYASFEDISQRVLLGRELQRQAHTDDLTGVANRRSLLERLALEFERVHRHPELRCCLLALDLDHFKAVNDHWGHATGDAVLVHVAQQMQKSVRSLDMVGRTGGEEFVVLLPDTRLDEAARLGERLRERMAQTPLQHAGHSIVVTVSLGLSEISPRDASADVALLRADQALYEAKAAGRNRLCVRPAATDYPTAPP
jgi:diguanylate cyclase (GGDEF)-like protein/PAS domain S-box-containing protein